MARWTLLGRRFSLPPLLLPGPPLLPPLPAAADPPGCSGNAQHSTGTGNHTGQMCIVGIVAPYGIFTMGGRQHVARLPALLPGIITAWILLPSRTVSLQDRCPAAEGPLMLNAHHSISTPTQLIDSTAVPAKQGPHAAEGLIKARWTHRMEDSPVAEQQHHSPNHPANHISAAPAGNSTPDSADQNSVKQSCLPACWCVAPCAHLAAAG